MQAIPMYRKMLHPAAVAATAGATTANWTKTMCYGPHLCTPRSVHLGLCTQHTIPTVLAT